MKRTAKLLAAIACSVLFAFAAAACGTDGGKTESGGTSPGQSAEGTLPESPETSFPADGESSGGAQDENGSAEPEAEKAKYIRIKTNGLNVRAGASASTSSLGQVDADMSMIYLGTENGFHKTYYRNRTGYVSAKSAYTELHEMEPASETVERVIEEGTKLIGTPYVYGAVRYHNGKGTRLSGFSVNKFDCSSLTQYIYYHGSGALLDLTTRTQIVQGTHVDRSDLRRGDLMFFTNSTRYNNTGIERVGHVAVYLGENLILHTASDYCKIEEISARRWGYYLETRRVVHI